MTTRALALGTSAGKIRVDHVSVTYGDAVAISDLSFEVADREVVSIIGGSGCGKTTLLHAIAGLQSTSGGAVEIGGRRASGPGPDRVMVFQADAVFPWMTVSQNVEYGLVSKSIPRAERAAIVERTLDLVELGGRGNLFPRQLSGGMRKRVDVARALAVQPEILLMDEPYAALDSMTKERLQEQFCRIQESTGMTAVFVTHDLEEAIFVADRVVVMLSSPGRLGSILEVPLARPRLLPEKRTAEFQALRGDLVSRLEAAGIELASRGGRA